MNITRTIARLALVPAVGASVLLGAGAASAHVSVTASDTAAGAYTVLTFSVPHGCDGSPTTAIDIKVPEEILAVTPTRQSFYEVATTSADLNEPVTDAHGNEITSRVDTVTYTADQPLPDGERDTFELSLQLPDAAGETLAFPVIQTCQKGETAWTEVAADGQDEHDLEHPAPTLTVTEVEDAHGHASESEAQDAETQGSDGNGLAVAGLVVGALGLAVGGTALVRTRKP